MKAFILSLTLCVAGVHIAMAQNVAIEPGNRETVTIPYNLSLVPSISVGDAIAGGDDVISNMSFTIIGGSAAGLEGVHYGGLWQTFTGDVTGVSSTIAVSTIGGDLHGTQSSWITNVVKGNISGGQASGFVNLAQGRLDGFQLAGIVNTGTTAFRGVQMAGIANNTSGPFAGLECAGISNTGAASLTGAQLAGFANIVNGRFTGLQASGLINCARHMVSGIQSAGFINVARIVGNDVIQIAPVNISQSNDGIPVGLVSYVADAGVGGDFWVDESGLMNLGLRTGNERFYNILSVGSRPGDPARWSVGWTFGGSIKVGNTTAFAIDGTFRHLTETDKSWTEGANDLITLRFLGQWQITDKLTFYAGPTFNYCRSENQDCTELTDWSLADEYANGKYHRIWPGFTIGISVR